MTSNVTAGSDTTAILMRTIFYSLLSHPDTLQRLLVELASLSPVKQPVTWKEARSLPYLDAVIKEAGRLHPPFGLPLERVVPSGGATICGQRFEGGTVVGMSAWVVHRDKDVFGKDAAEWRPERWLECNAEQRKRMEAGLLTVRFLIFPDSTYRLEIMADFYSFLVRSRSPCLSRKEYIVP